jgi:hypothetical protein
VQVDLAGIRPMPELTEVYQGVAAPKRKRVEDQPVITEVPQVSSSCLLIEETYATCQTLDFSSCSGWKSKREMMRRQNLESGNFSKALRARCDSRTWTWSRRKNKTLGKALYMAKEARRRQVSSQVFTVISF